MRKLQSALAAAFVVLLAGAAQADDPRDNQTRQDQPQQRDNQIRRDNPEERNDASREEQTSQGQPADTSGVQRARPDPAATGTTAQYSAELKRCDRMDADQKAQCVASARKRFGEL